MRMTDKRHHHFLIVAIILICAFVPLLVLVCCVWSAPWLMRVRTWLISRRCACPEGDLPELRLYPRSKALSTRPRRRAFTLIELSDATKGFSSKQKLGSGGFGCVYKGVLADASVVAVKRFLASPPGAAGAGCVHSRGEKQFLAEISLITELSHPNLVPLKGWCRESHELLLVYEYMPNGSLDRHVRGDDAGARVLPWPQRYGFVVDIAKALHFLHSGCPKGRIIHRDVKSSNVLIDGRMRARLGDFGMARLVDYDRTPVSCSTMAGTTGYMAPEAAYSFKATSKMDVFSFGVMLLEIVAGRAPIDIRRSSTEAILIDWVWHLHTKGRLLEAADQRLKGQYKMEELLRLLQLGLVCSFPDPKLRCDMGVVMDVLKRNRPVPPLPNSRPMPFFAAVTSKSPEPSPEPQQRAPSKDTEAVQSPERTLLPSASPSPRSPATTPSPQSVTTPCTGKSNGVHAREW